MGNREGNGTDSGIYLPPPGEDLNMLIAVLRGGKDAGAPTAGRLSVTTLGGGGAELPDTARRALLRIVEILASGDAAAVEPANGHLTVQQAAGTLNVGEETVLKMIVSGDIPHRMSGGYHTLAVDDIATVREHRKRAQHSALAAISEPGDEGGETPHRNHQITSG